MMMTPTTASKTRPRIEGDREAEILEATLQLLATAGYDKTTVLWDVHDPASPRSVAPPLRGHSDSVWSLAFAPNGRTLASGSYDDSVRLWDVGDPAHPVPLGALTGHNDDVLPVRFSPDGQLLASGSQDGSVILWDVGEPRHARELHRERPRRHILRPRPSHGRRCSQLCQEPRDSRT